MAKVKMLVELEYDAESMHSGDADKEAKRWFMESTLLRKGIKDPLLLHCNDIGDTVGEITVLEVHPF